MCHFAVPFLLPSLILGSFFLYVVAAGRFVVEHVSMRRAWRCACMAVCVGGLRTCTLMVGRCVVRPCPPPCLFLFLLFFSSSSLSRSLGLSQ